MLFRSAPINDDANTLVGELAEFMRAEIEHSGVTLDVKLDHNLPPIPFDRRFMKQALLNLVKNAVAAMPNGGSLSLATMYNADELRIVVSDTGIGIAENKIGKIFEPYYTTRENGTGLGLTLSYKIVKEHGGDITVRSKQGSGSQFTVTIPVPQKERRMLSTETDQAPMNPEMNEALELESEYRRYPS